MAEVPTDVAESIARLNLYNISLAEDPYTLIGPNRYGYVERWPAALHDTSKVANWMASLAPTLVVSPDSSVASIVSLTQAEYDELDPPNAVTLYVIVA